MKRIAILALQGAFAEHAAMLNRLGAETHYVRSLSDWLMPKDALVIPGGESTSQLTLLRALGLLQPVRTAILDGLPVFGTCAGLILLARYEDGTPRDGLATLDVDVHRNAYGRQIASFHTIGAVDGVGQDVPMTFIRAPYVNAVRSADVHVLATTEGRITAVRQGRQLATAFHPELTDDTRIHEYFLSFL